MFIKFDNRLISKGKPRNCREESPSLLSPRLHQYSNTKNSLLNFIEISVTFRNSRNVTTFLRQYRSLGTIFSPKMCPKQPGKGLNDVAKIVNYPEVRLWHSLETIGTQCRRFVRWCALVCVCVAERAQAQE